MAESITKGIREVDSEINIKIFNSAKTDKNDLITEVFKSKAILVGSPTILKGILSSIAEIMEMIKGLKFKNKLAAAFGCYGWSGESVKVLTEHLEKSGFSIINEGIRVKWNPDDESLVKCVEFGKEIAGKIK
jgi:flavorubredoxin